ncbi:MAG: hypothetical protein A2149_08710 [Candidatus Schekmanbacteria bacterium RBG_16_38_11]|uniref:Uncharacterized protein n=1 Tax=Candidatus Schekmanbacteria bacterium RBG_16_38_11 TaxID=1817880 RepID=A0A1F7RS02_9BACT|nr:MAG: hypothetical protein A2149_08710 [Candidatus Schekmanbacteria bacterium RBG_16_38_11]
MFGDISGQETRNYPEKIKSFQIKSLLFFLVIFILLTGCSIKLYDPNIEVEQLWKYNLGGENEFYLVSRLRFLKMLTMMVFLRLLLATRRDLFTASAGKMESLYGGLRQMMRYLLPPQSVMLSE